MLFDDRTKAIVHAQWRSLLNYYPRGKSGPNLVSWFLMGLWYLAVAYFAWMISVALPEVRSLNTVRKVITGGAVLALLYWQVIPLVLASSGMSLQLKRLVVYPIPLRDLFAVEVLLRVTTGIEPLMIMVGAMAGLWQRSDVPGWAPLIFIPFAVFNMILSAGLRDLLMRLLSRRGIRELVVIGFVMISALPQIVFTALPKEKLQALERSVSGLPTLYLPMPWNVTGRIAAGFGAWTDGLAMLAWLSLAAWFGYGQFLRNLRWDAGQARSDERAAQRMVRTGLWDKLLSLPSRVLPDPWGVLVEKEIRFLSRAPRFRLVFFMGFTFGLAIWLPLMLGGRKTGGFFTENFLVVLSLYAALLMGEVLFWNLFGFDRHAAQAYFAMPVPLRRVVLAKNLTALIMLLLEIAMVGLVVFALRLPITLEKVAESAAITLLFSLFLFSAGNLASMKYPRAVDPAQTWRNNSSAKVQGLLMLVYPALLAPVGLSYLARFAFDSQLAFYLVWAANLLVAAMAYKVSLDSAMEVAEQEKERIVQTLSSGDSLVA